MFRTALYSPGLVIALFVGFSLFPFYAPMDAEVTVGEEVHSEEGVSLLEVAPSESNARSVCGLYIHSTSNSAASSAGCNAEIFDDPDGDGYCFACVSYGSGHSCTPCGGGFCTDPDDPQEG